MKFKSTVASSSCKSLYFLSVAIKALELVFCYFFISLRKLILIKSFKDEMQKECLIANLIVINFCYLPESKTNSGYNSMLILLAEAICIYQ